MVELTPEQKKVKSRITNGAITLGVIVGVAVAVIAWLIGGNWNTIVRWIVALGAGGGLGYLAYRLNYASGVSKAVCGKCGTAFGIREIEQHEDLISTETKSKVEQVKGDKIGGPTTRTTTWVEDVYKVTAIDECSACGNRTERTWNVTRERDKVERPLSRPPTVSG
jgi:hypothetical protein